MYHQIISATCVFCTLAMASALPAAVQTFGDKPIDTTVHLFVLMIPDSTVQRLRKARQEEAGEGLTETGAYVGQIISGVLGGDVRPIFAGSASFIDEPDVQQGVSTILANVAPSVNNILKQWFTRVQTALGISSTPVPGTFVNGTGNVPLNGVGLTGNNQQRLTPQQLLQLQQQQQVVQGQQQPGSSGSVIFSSGNSGNAYQQTTVEPLPILQLKPTDEDNEEGENDHYQSVYIN